MTDEKHILDVDQLLLFYLTQQDVQEEVKSYLKRLQVTFKINFTTTFVRLTN